MRMVVRFAFFQRTHAWIAFEMMKGDLLASTSADAAYEMLER